MRNAGLDESQAGIKIARRNINNLRYAESEEELKSLLMKVKEESEKIGLKLSIQNNKIMASGPITSWQIDGEICNINNKTPGTLTLKEEKNTWMLFIINTIQHFSAVPNPWNKIL